ncbi:MAG: hypothetical protein QXD82_06065 [Nitrososphaerales archaeon]
MEKIIGEVKIVETDTGFRVEFEGENAKEILKKWREGQTCCSCC